MKSGFILILNIITITLFSQNDSINYFDQFPPHDVPVVFAKNQVCLNNRGEERITFSPEGDELFFGIHTMDYKSHKILHAVYSNGEWTNPDTAFFCETGNYYSPVFSPDGQQLFFMSSSNVVYIGKSEDAWGDVNIIDQMINSIKGIGNPSVTSIGTLYFITNVQPETQNTIYKSELKNNEYSNPVSLPGNINNGTSSVYDPFIAPDESYLIFAAKKTGGFGNGDLYISYHNLDDSWTDPINLGSKINTASWEYAPVVSPDGNYLFFTRWTSDNQVDIYWVNAGFINDFKPTHIIIQKLNALKIYPNPANEKVYVKYAYPLNGIQYQISDLNGAIIQTGKLYDNYISISDFSEGIYLLSLFINGEIINKNLVIQF